MTLEQYQLLSQIGFFLFVILIVYSFIPPKYYTKYPKTSIMIVILGFSGLGASAYINSYKLPKKTKLTKTINYYNNNTIDTVYYE